METTDQNQKSKNMRIGLIILGILLLLSLIFLVIFTLRSKRLANENETLEGEKRILIDEFQSIRSERDVTREQAADIEVEAERLKVAYEEEIRNRDAQISGLRARANEVTQLRQQVEEFKLMQADYESLQAQHTGLSAEHKALNDQFNVLSSQFTMLQDSVDMTRGLHVYNITPLTKWERWLWADRYNVSQARRVDQTEITFEIAATPFAMTGARNVYLNMLNPEGQIMYPSEETFIKNDTGETVPYTQMQEIEFSGEKVPLRFKVEHPERLDPGNYRFEVYIDGNLVNSKELILE
jgi:cell division protein FtsB